MSRTTFSAAWRMTSSSDARSAGTVIEKETRPSFNKYLGHQPQIDDVALQVRPFDLAQPFEDLFFAEAHCKRSL